VQKIYAEMVAACKEPSRQLDTPIGTTAVELDSRSTTVRSRETAIGALIADAMRWSAQTEVAMTNGGGIRGGAGSIRPARPSRGATVLAELPFGIRWPMHKRACYSLIVRTTLEVGRPSLAGPFTCFKIASS
jgi:hypothetical protein